MAILKIAKMGNPVLSKVAKKVNDPQNPEIVRLIQDMVDTMIDANGLGLAAPQVHVSKQIVVFYIPSHNENDENEELLTILINPLIEPINNDIFYDWEGCLSVPDLRGWVPRYKSILYKGIDHLGNKIETKAEGLHARVVQHECDHLYGYLYPQRMKNLDKLVFNSEMKYHLSPEG